MLTSIAPLQPLSRGGCDWRTAVGRGRRQSRSLVGWVAGWLLLAVLPVAAADPIRLDLFLGFDGILPASSWFPAVFEIRNEGPGFQGYLEVTSGQLPAGVRRGMALELPSGTTKRLVLPLYHSPNHWGSWDVTLRDERNRLRAQLKGQGPRRRQDPQLPMAAALSRLRPPLPELPGRQPEAMPAFARMLVPTFPDHAITLEGLDTLYLASEQAMGLRSAQVGAILAWLQAGGHLVIGLEQPGHLAGTAEWLRPLLPVEVPGPTLGAGATALRDWVAGPGRRDGSRRGEAVPGAAVPAPDPAFERAVLPVASVRLRDGRILAGTAEAPLVVSGRRGLGQVTLLTFAPELEPFRSWTGAPLFWAKLVNLDPDWLARAPTVAGRVSRQVEGVLGAVVDSRQVRKLPVSALLLLLVVYLMVIGPVDRFCLRKLNRQMLTWITFPCYVAFFSFLIYFIGYRLRAGETEWNELQVVDLIPRAARADWRGWTFASVYSPVNARYRVASAQPVAVLRGESGSGFQRASQESAQPRVRMVNQGFEAELEVPVWTSQLVVSDWRREGPASLGLGFDGAQVRVTNHLSVRLASMRLIRGNDIYTLGSLGPGEVTSQALSALPRQALGEYVRGQVGAFRRAADARQRAFGDNAAHRLPDVTNALMGACFGSLLVDTDDAWQRFRGPPGFDLQRSVARGDAVLLAFVPGHSPVPSLHQFPARRHRQDTLYRLAVPAPPLP